MSDSFAIPWTVAHQAPRSVGFPRQEYWSGLPFPSLEHLADSEIEPRSPATADSTTEPPGKFFIQQNDFEVHLYFCLCPFYC